MAFTVPSRNPWGIPLRRRGIVKRFNRSDSHKRIDHPPLLLGERGNPSPMRSLALLIAGTLSCAHAEETIQIATTSLRQGVICVVGLEPEAVLQMCKGSEVTVFAQAESAANALTLRRAAFEAGLLGTRVFVSDGDAGRICLSSDLADEVILPEGSNVPEMEVLRVLHPAGKARIGTRVITKPVPEGYDDWSHAFHGPDNNPQSKDQILRGGLRTQFIGMPKFSPMPEQSVIAGGRIYKAMGHIAHKENQNAQLNTLLGINAYNGTILWRRQLPEGFMIHRNTMIATKDGLLLGDSVSCKIIDGGTGEIRDEIVVPPGLADGPVWKWMGLVEGTLYALVGHSEVEVGTVRSDKGGIGHWPWSMWQGHDYADPATSFGFGRTVVAFDLKTERPLWHHRENEYLDARGMVMNDRSIFCYAPGKFLLALDRRDGHVLWKRSDPDLLAAIGPNGKAQIWMTGYATSNYLKCSADHLFFAGPQRERLAVVRTEDGSVAWTHDTTGNLQLVLRDDAIYAAGPEKDIGVKLDYATGKVLAEFPGRRACTRATGCADSIFFRATGGTVRVMTETNNARHIAPMRPPCQDGVLIANGHAYWGPWMCGCQLSLYGNVCLSPQYEVETAPESVFAGALMKSGGGDVVPLGVGPGDWTQWRGGPKRADVASVPIPERVKADWTAKICLETLLPTAPVTGGGLVFVADGGGRVQALDARNGKLVWDDFTGGPIYYPPAVSQDRVFAGSADGRVYAWEAKTGRRLWSFRAGPKEQRIPVFGQMISSWPVAAGVVVQDGVVYAASGITHYDGTYVVAVDAKTGALRASNTTSGMLNPEVGNGVSLQGELKIVNGKLQFAGGGVYEMASYDLRTLACRNEPVGGVRSQYRTAFYPYYPEYNRYVSLEHHFDDGRILNHDVNYEGLYFTPLSLLSAPPPGAPKPVKDGAGEFIRMQQNRRSAAQPGSKSIWTDRSGRRFHSFIVSGKRLLAAGHSGERETEPVLSCLDVETGTDLWCERLPAPVVKGGTAIDSKSRLFAVLTSGDLRAYFPAAGRQ